MYNAYPTGYASYTNHWQTLRKMIKKIVFLLIITFLWNCIEKQKNEKVIEPKQNKTSKKLDKNLDIENKHCYVKKVNHKNGNYSIIVDYIEFLTGKEAYEKAKKNKDLDFEINEKGDSTFFLYNDYYISNINPKLREFKLDSKVKIKLWNYPKNNGIYNDVSVLDFLNHLHDNPVIILKIKDGVISEMFEQYTP